MPFCKGPARNQTKVPFQVSRKPQGRRPRSNVQATARAVAHVPLSSSGAVSARQIRPCGNNQQKIQRFMVVQSTWPPVRPVAFGPVRKAWPAFTRCRAGVRVSDAARLMSPQIKAGEGTPEDQDNHLIHMAFRTIFAFGPTVLRATRRPADIRPAPQPMRSPHDPRERPACLRRIVRHSWQRAAGGGAPPADGPSHYCTAEGPEFNRDAPPKLRFPHTQGAARPFSRIKSADSGPDPDSSGEAFPDANRDSALYTT